MKNGAELLDRLVKDIVSESASSYVSVLHHPANFADDDGSYKEGSVTPAFSLPRFIPLLQERINVINPFTRTFLVAWITLLDAIPDLELVTFLPSFLGGLFRFLSDPNQDVHTVTQSALERFLQEIKKIARIKRGIAESRRSREEDGLKRSHSSSTSLKSTPSSAFPKEGDSIDVEQQSQDYDEKPPDSTNDTESDTANDEQEGSGEEDWIPGQDVQVDHPRILEILVSFLSDSSGLYLRRPCEKFILMFHR